MNEHIVRELNRTDLKAIGLVLIAGSERSVVLWCDPDINPEPLYADAAAHGLSPGALILVHADAVTSYVNEHAKSLGWFTRYLASLTQDLHRRGLSAVLRSAATQGELGLSAPAGQAMLARN